MKHYPSIDGSAAKYGPMPKATCIAFDKLDGSNIRCEWNKKQGWYKFGTRNQLLDPADPLFGRAADLFRAKYSEVITKVIKSHPKWKEAQEVIAYVEFLGPHSFAGWHDAQVLGVESNEPMDVVLFDVNVHKRGFVSPRDFVKIFGSEMDIAKVVYEGELTNEFVQDVRDGKYTQGEGVICKGGEGHHIWMRKIKTLVYLARLKEMFQQDWQKYWE